MLMPDESPPRLRRRALAQVLALSSLLLAACPKDAQDPYATPDQRGNYLAGTVQSHFTHSEGMSMNVQLWYPVEPNRDAEEQEYIYDPIGITSGSAADGAPGACDRPRPVIVYSHGLSAMEYQSFTLTETFARHGYVVIAPEHVGNSTVNPDPDLQAAYALRRPTDVAEAFDYLVSWSGDPDAPVYGCVDPDAGYVIMGHSFGAWTTLTTAGALIDASALATLESSFVTDADRVFIDEWLEQNPGRYHDLSDARVWAAVAHAPGLAISYGDEGLANITVPTMIIGAMEDEMTPYNQDARVAYEGLTVTPRYLAGLTNAGHYSFASADFCFLLTSLSLPSDGCTEEFRPIEEVLQTIQELTLAFLDSLQGETRARDWLPVEIGLDEWRAVEE